MSKLLIFLVESRLSETRLKLTAYTVAVDALGRDENFDTEIDSYPRVQISRLRKILDSFYLREGGNYRLTIPRGNYELLLEPNTIVPKSFSPHNPIIRTESEQETSTKGPLSDRTAQPDKKTTVEFSLSLNALVPLAGLAILSLAANTYWALAN